MIDKTNDAAEAALMLLETPCDDYGTMGVPFLVTSRPGQGKTAFFNSLAAGSVERPMRVEVVPAGLYAPTDIGGLPVQKGDHVTFLPPSWAHRVAGLENDDVDSLLLLDDLTHASPQVQNACLRLIQFRVCGDLSLGHRVRVAAAANTLADDSTVNELGAAVRNRFLHLHWESDRFADWLEHGFPIAKRPVISAEAFAAQLPRWRTTVARFLRSSPEFVNTQPCEDELAYATPRSWEAAIRAMTTAALLGKSPKPGARRVPSVFGTLLHGAVGKVAGDAFLAYLKRMRLPDPDLVLRNKQKVELSTLQLPDDELFVFFDGLNAAIERLRPAAGAELARSVIVYLTYVQELQQENGRLDVGYPAIDAFAKSGVLQEALAAAASNPKLHCELKKSLDRTFGSSSRLAHMVQLLSDKNR